MKKIIAIVLVLALALTCFAACGPKAATGVQYGKVHGAGYVGKATVTVEKGKITAATLEECCFPSQITDPAGVDAADLAAYAGKHGTNNVYKTVKFGSNTLVFDEAKNDYVVNNGETFGNWLNSEANCEAYYKAVEAGEVKVVVGGAEKTGIMTVAALMKDQNGYGGTNFDWKGNRNATVNYVVGYGFGSTLTKNDDGKFVDANGVDTGATWTDMNTEKDGTISYMKLLEMAYNKVAK